MWRHGKVMESHCRKQSYPRNVFAIPGGFTSSPCTPGSSAVCLFPSRLSFSGLPWGFVRLSRVWAFLEGKIEEERHREWVEFPGFMACWLMYSELWPNREGWGNILWKDKEKRGVALLTMEWSCRGYISWGKWSCGSLSHRGHHPEQHWKEEMRDAVTPSKGFEVCGVNPF